MLAISILLSACFSTCLSQKFTINEKVVILQGKCAYVKYSFSYMSQNTSIVFVDWPKEIMTIEPTSARLIQKPFQSGTEYYFMFCLLHKNVPLKQFHVVYYFFHDSILYPQQVNPITVNIVSSLQNMAIPVIQWKSERIKGTCADFNVVTSGNDGVIYYSVRNKWTLEPALDFSNQLELCKEDENACTREILYPMYHHFEKRQNTNVMIQAKRVTTNETRLVVRGDLIQGAVYIICAFYHRIERKDNSITTCKQFKTDASQNMLRAHFKFTQQISLRKLNVFLCFLTSYLGLHLKDLMTIDGLSCSVSWQWMQPNEFYHLLRWRMAKTIRYGNETIIYINNGCSQAKNKILEVNFSLIWNINGRMSSYFRGLLKENDLTWVKDTKNLGFKNFGEMLYPNKSIDVRFSTKKIQVKTENKTFTFYKIENITSSNYGSVYFSYLIFKIQAGAQPSFIPEKAQIISCQSNVSIIQPTCKRVFFTGQTRQPPSVEFEAQSDLKESQYAHKIFYVEVGEYPKFPITSSEVKEVRFGEDSLQDGKVKEAKNETETGNVKEAIKQQEPQEIVKKYGDVILVIGIMCLSFIMI